MAEQAFYFYLKKIFPDAISRCKGLLPKRMELDIYIPSQKLAIEYDGSFWHKDTSNRDQEKYAFCQKNKIRLMRIVEKQKTGVGLAADEIFSTPNMENRESLARLIQYVLDQLDPRSNLMTRRNPCQVYSPIRINLKRDQYEIQRALGVKKEDSLGIKFPKLMQEWHPTKNDSLTPFNIKPGSDLNVWWKCQVCHYEWKATVAQRVGGTGYPSCYRKRIKTASPLGRKIYQLGEDYNLIKEWRSISEASRALRINSSNISMCAKGKRPRAVGFVWAYELKAEQLKNSQMLLPSKVRERQCLMKFGILFKI